MTRAEIDKLRKGLEACKMPADMLRYIVDHYDSPEFPGSITKSAFVTGLVKGCEMVRVFEKKTSKV